MEKNFIGPALPPSFNVTSGMSSEDDSEDDETHNIQQRKEDTATDRQTTHRQIGPGLPPGFSKEQESEQPGYSGSASGINIGPQLPPSFQLNQSDSDEQDTGDVIGPLPSAQPVDYSVAAEFENRAARMREKLTTKEEDRPAQRETWMTEAPSNRTMNLGLTARKLGHGATHIDSSSWTETPAQREKHEQGGRKQKRKYDDEKTHRSERDAKLGKEVAQYNESKRAESLLEMHTKKLNKKKKKEKKKQKEKKEKPARVPFNRETDMKVSGMDSAAKKAFIKQSQQFNSRFSSPGISSKFI